MPKAERKDEMGEEQAKQRQLTAILHRLTPRNIKSLVAQVVLNIDNVVTLCGLISQIYEKALTDSHLCEMHADFCHRLAGELPDLSENNEKITFKRLLLNKCQEEFESGEREQEEASSVEKGEVKNVKEKRIQARRRMLGNIRFIGELYKKKMLTGKIMHSCINKWLGQNQNPNEDDIESLCILMCRIGEMIDHPIAKDHMDTYFDKMDNLSTNMKLSSRVRLMLKDTIDLRRNKWQQKRKVYGPEGYVFIHSFSELHRNSRIDRWQRATGLQVMPKAERKDEMGEEQAKQRQLTAILHRLTPRNIKSLVAQVVLNIDNVVTLCGLISQIYEKALTDSHLCEMHADFCHHLAGELPDFSANNEIITFRRLLLNMCQEEFESGEREQEEASSVEKGEVKNVKEKRIQARRRMLGNIRFLGELYKKKMLTGKIMHSCINKLLGQNQNPNEDDIESLCILMCTIGEMIDHPIAKDHMDTYFDKMDNLSTNMKLSSRVRLMLKDTIDLRRNKWQQKRKVYGPEKNEDVHRDGAQELHAESQIGR